MARDHRGASVIYKICSRSLWSAAREAGEFRGSRDDLRDGFIHLSTREQLPGTLAKHFAGEADLILIGIDAARLGPALRWEPSRGGALFPHLYAPLPLAAVLSETALILGEDGRHQLSGEIDAC